VEYFCEGMADSFESVKRRAQEAAGSGAQDRSPALRRLDPRQRKALELFRDSNTITSRDIEALFGISQRAARNLLTAWVDSFSFGVGFFGNHQFNSTRKADTQLHGKCSSTQSILLTTAINERRNLILQISPDVQHSDAFGSVNFVSRQTHHVSIARVETSSC
jgi:hypothetical protein